MGYVDGILRVSIGGGYKIKQMHSAAEKKAIARLLDVCGIDLKGCRHT